MQYDYSVFIGRFQPFHNGHKYVVEEGLKISKKMLIFCGSANQYRSIKNPWNYEERKLYISKSFSGAIIKKLYISPLADHPSDAVWVKRVQEKVKRISDNKTSNVAIIGHQKDRSSYYLKLFPQYHMVQVENFQNISATYIRQQIFTQSNRQEVNNKIQHLVPSGMLRYLLDFLGTTTYLKLKKCLEM